jgi:AcrR family transcriptional regulator
MTTAGPGRPRDQEVDRRIMRAALDVFADVGWAGFTMEAVARRAGAGKASVYLRWRSKETLLIDAVSLYLGLTNDFDTGTLHGDLVQMAKQSLEVYAGDNGRAVLRLSLEADAVSGLAKHYESMRRSQRSAARAIVRRGIARGELPEGTSVDLILNTIVGGAMIHADQTPLERRAELVRNSETLGRRLVDFVLNAVTTHSSQSIDHA